jgi:hypothetical protein
MLLLALLLQLLHGSAFAPTFYSRIIDACVCELSMQGTHTHTHTRTRTDTYTHIHTHRFARTDDIIDMPKEKAWMWFVSLLLMFPLV